MKSIFFKLIILCIIFIFLTSCGPSTAEEEVVTTSEEQADTVTTATPPVENTEELPTITIGELFQLLGDTSGIIIVDVRSKTSYEESHIKGAISVPESVIGAGEWQPPEGKTLILY